MNIRDRQRQIMLRNSARQAIESQAQANRDWLDRAQAGDTSGARAAAERAKTAGKYIDRRLKELQRFNPGR